MGPREAALAVELLGVGCRGADPLGHLPHPGRHAGRAAPRARRARPAGRGGPRLGAGRRDHGLTALPGRAYQTAMGGPDPFRGMLTSDESPTRAPDRSGRRGRAPGARRRRSRRRRRGTLAGSRGRCRSRGPVGRDVRADVAAEPADQRPRHPAARCRPGGGRRGRRRARARPGGVEPDPQDRPVRRRGRCGRAAPGSSASARRRTAPAASTGRARPPHGRREGAGAHGGVVAAAPPVRLEVTADPPPVAAPNDTYWSKQWGIDAIGVRSGWALTRGRPEIVVAVVDTGVDLGHPDLAGRLVIGTDVGSGDGNPTDENGHGTHVAGIVAATSGNARGVSGVAPGVVVMPVKVMDDDGSIWDTAVAEGIAWAVARGARVVNMSLGGDSASPAIDAAIDDARTHGRGGGRRRRERWRGREPAGCLPAGPCRRCRRGPSRRGRPGGLLRRPVRPRRLPPGDLQQQRARGRPRGPGQLRDLHLPARHPASPTRTSAGPRWPPRWCLRPPPSCSRGTRPSRPRRWRPLSRGPRSTSTRRARIP